MADTHYKRRRSHLQGFGLGCVSEKINWNCLNDPAFYFGQVAFERLEKSAHYQTSLSDRLEWFEDAEVEVAINSKKHRADMIKWPFGSPLCFATVQNNV